MKKKIVGIVVAAVLVCGAAGCATHGRDTAFEYKVLQVDANHSLEKQLNDLSQQGWLVVSITTSRLDTDNRFPEVIALLKRPKQ